LCTSPTGEPGEIEEKVLLQWLIPNEYIGSLIGKKGAGIHQISADSGAKVRVAHEEELPPGSPDRLVYILGPKAASDRALAMIRDKLKVQGKPFDAPHADSLMVPLACIPALLGAQGSIIRAIREKSGCRIHVTNLTETEIGTTDSRIDFDGPPETVALGKGKGMVEGRVVMSQTDHLFIGAL